MSERTSKETEPMEQKPPVIEPTSNRKGFRMSFLVGGALFITEGGRKQTSPSLNQPFR